MNLFDASAIVLLSFAVLGAVDGLYLHLWRFRLHARAASRTEHWFHTGRAILFVPMLPLVFAGDTAGGWLWLGVGVLLADLGLTVADVLVERGSRSFQGGLPKWELRLHIVLTLLHVAAAVLVLAARPAAAWWTTTRAPVADVGLSHFVAWVVLLPGSVLVAVLHLALARWPVGKPRPSAELARCRRERSLRTELAKTFEALGRPRLRGGGAP